VSVEPSLMSRVTRYGCSRSIKSSSDLEIEYRGGDDRVLPNGHRAFTRGVDRRPRSIDSWRISSTRGPSFKRPRMSPIHKSAPQIERIP